MFGSKSQTKRIEELESEVRTLRGQVHDLDVEWSATYEKIRILMARLAKRAQVAKREPDLSEIAPEAPQTHDPITARVLARRNAHGLPRDVSR